MTIAPVSFLVTLNKRYWARVSTIYFEQVVSCCWNPSTVKKSYQRKPWIPFFIVRSLHRSIDCFAKWNLLPSELQVNLCYCLWLNCNILSNCLKSLKMNSIIFHNSCHFPLSRSSYYANICWHSICCHRVNINLLHVTHVQ